MAVIGVISILLVGCGNEEVEQPKQVVEETPVNDSTKEKEPTTLNVEFGETLEINPPYIVGEEHYSLSFANPRIEQDFLLIGTTGNADHHINDDNYFLLVDVSIENLHSEELDLQIADHVYLYDKNGREVLYHMEEADSQFAKEIEAFQSAKLRPEGKNEGTIVLRIPKETELSELIYNDIGNNGNEYIYTLSF